MHDGYYSIPLPDDEVVNDLWNRRLEARRNRRFAEADDLKRQLEELGMNVNQLDRLYAGPLRSSD